MKSENRDPARRFARSRSWTPDTGANAAIRFDIAHASVRRHESPVREPGRVNPRLVDALRRLDLIEHVRHERKVVIGARVERSCSNDTGLPVPSGNTEMKPSF